MDYINQNRRQTSDDQTGTGNYQGTFDSNYMLAEDIAKAITGEVQAYYFYEDLANLAPTEEDSRIIRGIQEDEAKHNNWFTAILNDLGGTLPRIPAGEQPEDFESGVRKAIQDELTANEFYLDISYNVMDPDIKMTFLYASQDEQRHAAYLLSLLV